jgi:hypothetical protein
MRLADRPKLLRPSMQQLRAIQGAVAEYFKVPVDLMWGKSRYKRATYIRQVAMFICRFRGGPFAQVGKAFGRDHTSVIYGCNKIDRNLEDEDPETTRDMLVLQPLLEPQMPPIIQRVNQWRVDKTRYDACCGLLFDAELALRFCRFMAFILDRESS